MSEWLWFNFKRPAIEPILMEIDFFYPRSFTIITVIEARSGSLYKTIIITIKI